MTNMEIAARDEAKHKGLMYNEYDRFEDVEGGGTRGPSRKNSQSAEQSLSGLRHPEEGH